MKLDNRKISINQSSLYSALVSVGSFLVAFTVQMLFVFRWNYFRYPNEEFQIMAMGAQSYGYSWSNLINSSPYGGIIFTPIYRFLFGLGISGTAAYRVMRWGLAFLNAVPAFIVSRIADKVYKLGYLKSAILGIVAVLAATSRASSVRTEVFLSLLVWILVYELIVFSSSNTVKSKNIHSAIIGVLLALMPFLNVRAIVIMPAVVLTIVLVRVFKKRWFVSLPIFIPAFLIVSGICIFLADKILLNYSLGQAWETSWSIEMRKYLYLIFRGVQRLHMSYGIRGFLDVFISNIWIIAIFSFGIVIYVLFYMISLLRSGKERGEFESGVFLLLWSSVLLSIVVISLCGIKTGISIHTHGEAPDGMFFKLETYGYLVNPLLLLGIMSFIKSGKDQLRVLLPSMGLVLISSVYLLVSVIVPAIHNGHVSMKWWFGYEMPFLVFFNQWADKNTGVWLFVFPTVIVLFLMWCYHISKDYKSALSLFLLVSFIQYGYIEFYWANKSVFRDRFDAFIDCVNVGALCQSDIKDVYWDGDRDTAYALQLALPNISVHIGFPEKGIESALILTGNSIYSVSEKYSLGPEYKVVSLDSNETFITNDDNIINFLSGAYELYRADDGSFAFVTYVYNQVLGRDPDPVGLNGWAADLRSGRMQPSDLILATFSSAEFQGKEYTDEELAAAIVKAFIGATWNKEQIHTFAERLANGESIEELSQEFVDSEAYYDILSSYGLRDSHAHRLNGYVSHVYETILRRPADGYGLSDYTEMISNGELSPIEFVHMTLSSPEYEAAGHSTAETVTTLHLFFTNTLPSTDVVTQEVIMIEAGELTLEELENQLAGTVAYQYMIMDYNIGEYF